MIGACVAGFMVRKRTARKPPAEVVPVKDTVFFSPHASSVKQDSATDR
jgi:hypothetical protein